MSSVEGPMTDNTTLLDKEIGSGDPMTSPDDGAPAAASSSPPATVSVSFIEEPSLEEELFERRKRVIQTSWRAVQFGLDVQATQVFYDKLFEEFPCVREMFPENMEAQYRKLYQAVSLAVQYLDNVDELVPVLKELGVRHVQYGVVRAHYEAVTEAFLWTMNTYIFSHMPNGNAIQWCLDVCDAWDWALTFMGGVMADAADEWTEKVHREKFSARMAEEDKKVEEEKMKAAEIAAAATSDDENMSVEVDV